MLYSHRLSPTGSYCRVEIQTPISMSPSGEFLVESPFEFRRRLSEIIKSSNSLESDDELEDSVIFKQLERRYQSENILDYVFYPNEKPMKLHFLGDILQYESHFIECSELRSFLKDRFEINYKQSTRTYNLDDQYKNKYIKYNCVNGYIPKHGIKYARRSGWDAVPEYPKSKHDYSSYEDDRIVCAGCYLGKKVLHQYLMTAIDVVSNSIVVFDMGMDFINLLKQEYRKNNEKYLSIDQWIFDKDFIISVSGKGFSKKNEVVVLPSSYSSFSGEIMIPNKEYICLKNTEKAIFINHKYTGSFFSNLLIKDNMKMADICNIESDKGVVSFMRSGVDNNYKMFETKKHEERSIFANSSIGMLEI